MSDTPSKELDETVESFRVELASALAGVLEKRHAIKRHLGKTANDVEEEIALTCEMFLTNARLVISQRLLDAYNSNRYPVSLPKRKETGLPDMEFSVPLKKES